MPLFDNAKKFMRHSGNMSQWVNGYPSENVIRNDIAEGNFYVEETGEDLTGCFAFILGNDPTYAIIEGEWLNDSPYGTIHRLASSGGNKGFSDRCFEFCLGNVGNLRIDTHSDNRPMQKSLERNGFTYCGIIYIADGSPRKAYQLCKIMEENKLVFSTDYFLTAGECNARGEMPLTLMAERIIEIATNHANHLGIGYANLFPKGAGWVLSRMSIEMTKTPVINDRYSISTWIESWTRLFSERCMRFYDSDGNTIGWARTIWAAIDFNTRRPVDLTEFGSKKLIAENMTCPIPRIKKHGPVAATEVENLTFKYMDLDFNRHVNAVRYIEHILNLWPLSHYDQYHFDKFEITYLHECLAGQTVELAIDRTDVTDAAIDILRDGERVVSSTIHFTESERP